MAQKRRVFGRLFRGSKGLSYQRRYTRATVVERPARRIGLPMFPPRRSGHGSQPIPKGTTMSTISGVGGTSSAWSATASSRASAMRDKMFAKVDSDGSGSVDQTELQSMLDHISSKTGTSVGSAADLMSKMDSDGSGSLSQSELESGMKSLMPPPSSTVSFAQQRGGTSGGDGTQGAAPPDGPPPGGMQPPPSEAVSSANGAGSSTSSSSTNYDPLDTNQDGVVSAQERAAGDLKDLMKALDGNGDGSVSKSEIGSFLSQLQSNGASAGSTQSGASPSSTDSDGDNDGSRSADGGRFNLSALRDLVRNVYASAQADTQSSALSVAA
jgi:Ca2+-binding EF-hand superfamily protein